MIGDGWYRITHPNTKEVLVGYVEGNRVQGGTNVYDMYKSGFNFEEVVVVPKRELVQFAKELIR